MDIHDFLGKLTGVRANGHGWMAHCPRHDDREASLSVTVGQDGRILLHCFAGCEPARVVAAIGLTLADLFPDNPNGMGHPSSPDGFEHSKGSDTPSSGLTLVQYATAKRLPEGFLRQIGLSDTHYHGSPAVRISYRDSSGRELAVRFRRALDKAEGVERFRWKSGTKAVPYGLWRLKDAHARGYIVIVEGESDCQTLWYHGVPALGLPGASTWSEAWADYLDGVGTVYVVLEPDQGGNAIRNWLARSRIRDRARIVELGAHKDPSALYLADPDNFIENWQAALDRATAWVDLEKQAREAEAREAYALARDLLHDPNLLDRVRGAIRSRGYAGDVNPALVAYVAMTSRLLERPQNIAFVAPSAAGKNRAVDAALEFIPPEAVYIERAGSSRALVYVEEEFEHRVVVVCEADSIPEDGPAASAIRSLAADNVMAYDVVERDERTGRFVTRHIVKSGPTALVTTSTRSLGEQMGTRVLEIPVPDDARQTREVLKAHARSVRPGNGVAVNLAPFLALQRYLALGGETRVAVPYSDVLADLVPATAVRWRRDFRQLLTCVQCIALLHQCQRQRTPEGWVVATLDDYAAARTLLSPVFRYHRRRRGDTRRACHGGGGPAW